MYEFNTNPYVLADKKIFVAGHNGLVGHALTQRLEKENCQLVYASKAELDLRDRQATRAFLTHHSPNAVVMCAGLVGGVQANRLRQADFAFDNMAMALSIIDGAYRAGVEKLLYLGSSCVYPKFAANPIGEETLMTGTQEPTNFGYATAKIAGIKLCDAYRAQYGADFISAMPCNIYGPNDRFDADGGHVIPSLILKMRAALQQNKDHVTLWGSGRPRREFLYVDDLADALVFMLKNYSDAGQINIGRGHDIAISQLAEKVAVACGYKGKISYDASMPDGVMRKLMDSSRINLAGWYPSTSLEAGLQKTCDWLDQNQVSLAA